MLKKLILFFVFMFILSVSGCAKNVEDEEYHGGIYSGEWQFGKPNGHGKYTADTDGAVITYEGEWRSGTRHGHGVQVLESGDGSVLTYEGGWRYDKRHGEGLQIYERADGSVIIHEGIFSSDLLHGRGKMTVTYDSEDMFKSVEYEGDFVFGTKHGYGAEVEKGREGGIIVQRAGIWENDNFSD